MLSAGAPQAENERVDVSGLANLLQGHRAMQALHTSGKQQPQQKPARQRRGRGGQQLEIEYEEEQAAPVAQRH
uniref:Uncharacterized protein n=1 Tax=Tetradesmus obliquus TaxID=3088 RepID=A0A383W239_TETOB